jgi:hypothetical protein
MAKETHHYSLPQTSQAAAEQQEGTEMVGLSRPAVQAFPPPNLPSSPLGFARQRAVAFGQNPVQRTPTPTSPTYQSHNQLERMTVQEFDAYARTQAGLLSSI